uniref:Uncharacterized protein n=1 Tax=mine drainage metagenome TaxID=410659 RepID=E6QPD7_9ZZZZ
MPPSQIVPLITQVMAVLPMVGVSVNFSAVPALEVALLVPVMTPALPPAPTVTPMALAVGVTTAGMPWAP